MRLINGATTAQIPLPTPVPIHPSLSPIAHLFVTLLFTCFYGSLFVFAYWQLWLVYCLDYMRFTYQTAFLSLCLLFTSFRLLMFSCYIGDSDGADSLPMWFNGLLIEAPIILQYIIFALIISFYCKVLCNAQPSTFTRLNVRVQNFLIVSSVVFVLCNAITACTVSRPSPVQEWAPTDILVTDYVLVLVRVFITDGLFVVLAVLLSYCLFQLSSVNTARLVVDVQNMTYRHVKAVVICISILFSLRAVYNVIALLAHSPGFPFNWVDVTEQVDFVSLASGKTYIAFILVLLFYEIVPAFFVLYLFAIPRPPYVRCWPMPCCSECLPCCYNVLQRSGVCRYCCPPNELDPFEESSLIPEWAPGHQPSDYPSTIPYYSSGRPDKLHIQVSGLRSPPGSAMLTASMHSGTSLDHGHVRSGSRAAQQPSLLSSLVSPKSSSGIPAQIQQEKSYFVQGAGPARGSVGMAGVVSPGPYPPPPGMRFQPTSSSNSMAFVISPPRRTLLPPGYSKPSPTTYAPASRHRKSVSAISEVSTPGFLRQVPRGQPLQQQFASNPTSRAQSVVSLLPAAGGGSTDGVDTPTTVQPDATNHTTTQGAPQVGLQLNPSTITELHEDEVKP